MAIMKAHTKSTCDKLEAKFVTDKVFIALETRNELRKLIQG